jgi:peroxiredoxin
MKKIALLFIGLSMVMGSFAQEESHTEENGGKKIPSVQLKDMDGNTVNTADLGFDGPIIISFWATWCSPCKAELNTIKELYEEWQDETDVTLVAVSVDDQKTQRSVPMYVNGKSWEYVVLMDPNGDFKRAMGVNNVPHTFIIDTDGTIRYSHNNYSPGDEYELYDALLEVVGAE